MCIVRAEEERSERNFGRVLDLISFIRKMKISIKLMSHIVKFVR